MLTLGSSKALQEILKDAGIEVSGELNTSHMQGELKENTKKHILGGHF